MKLNNFMYCFVLWGVVDFVTITIACVRRAKERRLIRLIELYYCRLMLFTEKGIEGNDLLQELFFSFSNNRSLRKLLYGVVKTGDFQRGLVHIEKELAGDIVKYAHEKLLLQERIQKRDFDLWKSNQQKLLKLSTKNRVKTILEKNIVLLVNLWLYFKLNNSLSQGICVVVNTIGVILFIVLELEWGVVDGKNRDRKLAELLGYKNKTQFFQFVAGLGLILNISMIAAQLLEQAV